MGLASESADSVDGLPQCGGKSVEGPNRAKGAGRNNLPPLPPASLVS